MASIAEALTLAMQHHQAGALQQAERLYRQILQVDPQNVDALHLLGLLAKQVGRHDLASEHIRQALRLKPDNPEAHNNLGNVLQEQGKLEEAAASFQQAIRIKPNYAEAHYNLGNALKAQGKLDEAIASLQQAIRLKPNSAEPHNNLGNVLQDQGKLEEAVASLQQAVRLKPNFAEGHYNLGAAFRKQGKLEEAVASLQQAVRLKPNLAPAHNNLGNALKEQGKLEEAATSFQQAIRLMPNYAEAHNNLGTVLQNLGKLEEAVVSLQQALHLKPDSAEAHNNLGAALKDQGKLEEAVASFQQAIRIKPDYAEAYTNLGMVFQEQGNLNQALACYQEALRQRPNDPLAYHLLAQFAAQDLYALTPEIIEQGNTLLADGRMGAVDASLVHFALADVLDRQERHDDAFLHYQAGNTLMKRHHARQAEGFRADRHRAWIDQVVATFDQEYFARVGSLGSESERPVFVVGMPRSGTTLVSHILSSHPLVCGPGELPDVPKLVAALQTRPGGAFPYPACMSSLDAGTVRNLADRYLQRLFQVNETALRIIDKLPANFLHLGLIATFFPRARIIHCRRDPLDVCLSCYRQNFQNIDFAWSLEDLAAYYREYERLMAHWRKVLPLPMLEVEYEDLVARQEAVSRDLVAFCGLEWDPRCLSFHENRQVVQTASMLQVRRPLYAASIGRWKNYRTHLGGLISALSHAGANEAAG